MIARRQNLTIFDLCVKVKTEYNKNHKRSKLVKVKKTKAKKLKASRKEANNAGSGSPRKRDEPR